MIEITIKEELYKLESSWNDVTWSKYVRLLESQGKPVLERLAVACGIPLESVNKFTIEQLGFVSDLVSFMGYPESVEAFSLDYESDLVIGEEMYWRVEKCKQILKDVEKPLTKGASIIQIFTADKDGNGGEDINDIPVTKVIGRVGFFLSSWESSLSGSKG